MERKKPRITCEDLARFIERAAAGAMDPEERSRFLVNHYSDGSWNGPAPNALESSAAPTTTRSA